MRTTERRTVRPAPRRALIVLALAGCAGGATAPGATVSATLQPAEISMGEAAQLTVTCDTQTSGQPQIPEIPGLSFQHVGQSSRVQFINGAMSAYVTHTYLVVADRAGSFTIPAIGVASGGDVAESQPLTLLVRDAASPPAAQGPHHYGSWRRANPQPQAPQPGTGAAVVDPSGIGFLRIDSPKTSFVVGESARVELQAFFREGVELKLDGPPKFNSDAFTMKKLGDRPLRRRELVNGTPYTVLSWPTAITAVKAGNHEMSVEIPTTVTVRVKTRRPTSRMPGIFGDSLFDHFFDDGFFDDPFFNQFFGAATQKEVPLSSDPMPVVVESLPAEGRPEGFAGAVGRFEIGASATPCQANAGDPISLKVTVTGEGNFDRVSVDGVGRDATWKSYKPSATFQPAEDELAGTKVFEQAIVPLQGGRLEIPPVSLSYFDPEKRAYATVATPPIPVSVTPPAGTTPSPPTAPLASLATPKPQDRSPAEGLLPDKVGSGRTVRTLEPRFLSPIWLAVSLSPSLAAFGLWAILLWQRRSRADARRLLKVETRRRVREQIDRMKRAADRGEAPEFFAAARDALRHQLAARWDMPAHAITRAEVDGRLNGEAHSLPEIFDLADEAIFASRRFPSHELKSWLATVRKELGRLETLP